MKNPASTLRGITSSLRSIIIALALLPALAHAAADKFFDPFLGDLPGELASAKAAGKKGVLLVFHVDGCPFCERMREQIFARPEVQDYYHRQFTILQIDVNGSVLLTDLAGREVPEKHFARELRVVGTPTLIYLDLEGKEIHRASGAARDVAEFLARGRFVAEGHWRKSSFEQYRNARGKK